VSNWRLGTSQAIQEDNQARWWQLKHFLFFNPKIGKDEPILTIIFFRMGWFNHQPDIVQEADV